MPKENDSHEPIEIQYQTAVSEDFVQLTSELDSELREINGEIQNVYSPYNQLDDIKDIVVAYAGRHAVGCGAMKFYAQGIFEVKRVYVKKEFRARGIAGRLMDRLEQEARNRQLTALILETGDVLAPAIAMYRSRGYHITENYGQYKDMKQSVCMRKTLEY